MRTVLANLEFALNTAACARRRGALLLVRVDVEWKRMVALPLPAELGYELVSPWRVDIDISGRVRTAGTPWLNDVLLLVPACRLGEFWSALVRRVSTLSEPGRSLHFLCYETACGVRFLEACASANTEAERNSLYAIVNRHRKRDAAVPLL